MRRKRGRFIFERWNAKRELRPRLCFQKYCFPVLQKNNHTLDVTDDIFSQKICNHNLGNHINFAKVRAISMVNEIPRLTRFPPLQRLVSHTHLFLKKTYIENNISCGFKANRETFIHFAFLSLVLNFLAVFPDQFPVASKKIWISNHRTRFDFPKTLVPPCKCPSRWGWRFWPVLWWPPSQGRRQWRSYRNARKQHSSVKHLIWLAGNFFSDGWSVVMALAAARRNLLLASSGSTSSHCKKIKMK